MAAPACKPALRPPRRRCAWESYTIRFTPRRPNSNWSNVKIAKVERLTEEERTGVYSCGKPK